MQFRDLIVGTVLAGSSFMAPEAKAQPPEKTAIEQTTQSPQEKVMLGDFDITDYADYMKKRGFEINLERSGIGAYSGTTVTMLEVISTRKVDGREITVSDYLVHRMGRDFSRDTDGQKYDAGDLESRELTVRDDRKTVEYILGVDYDQKEKHYVGLSNVIGTGTRVLPAVSEADAGILLGRIGSDPASFINAERADILLSRRDMDGGGKNAPKP
ncbi:MAG: hypothetical protein EPN97_13210 [Alphaproteobacteria bacterium]|nr:MAG: hypothetical protein EPN97_13210 [Alphaproteobacteria bacterium]